MFNPNAPYITNPSTTSNPNASNPLSPSTQIQLQNRPSSGVTGDYTLEEWNRHVATIQAALQASSGWERTKLEAQYADAQKGRDNAMAIAQLNNQTSRYGTDQNTAVQMAQLRQNQQQFDANHGLELARAYTEYAKTPDMRWSAMDFDNALSNVGQGRSPAPISEQPAPHAKNWQDFAVLSGYGNQTTKAGASGGGAQASMQAGGGAADGGSKGDLRLKAVKAIGEAMPPSDGVGHDEQDWAALAAVKSLYFGGNPQGVNRLGAPRKKIALAGMGRLGYSPDLVDYDYQRGLANRGSAGAA